MLKLFTLRRLRLPSQILHCGQPTRNMATDLPSLPAVETISEHPRIVRILGGNPTKVRSALSTLHLNASAPDRPI